MTAKISFFGAARNVTGSKYLLEAGGRRILVDCGMYQERRLKGRNWEPFPFDPKSLDAVVLTHAHLDHVGTLPRLAKGGFRGPVWCTPATAEIASIVLLDAGYIQEEDARRKKKRHKRQRRKGPHPVVPLYTVADAERSLELFRKIPYDEELDLGGGIRAVFRDAGHILGSSMVRLRIGGDSNPQTVLFSGDVGRWGKPILRDPTAFEEADVLVVESTYGLRLHDPEGSVADRLAEEVDTAFRKGGNVIIPSFAIERSHEIMYHFNELRLSGRLPGIRVYIDSPMAIRATEVFRDHPELFDEETAALVRSDRSPFRFPGLVMSRSTEDSKAVNRVKSGAIVVAGSGMCTGGRVKHHLVHNIEREECTVLFTGYQAGGTLGREILEGRSPVRILGRHFHVRARIAKVNGFSGHADRDELLRWVSAIDRPPKRIFVTHGEEEAALAFAGLLGERFDAEIAVPEYGETHEIGV
jgi:metallo-beta-lactamase family protein